MSDLANNSSPSFFEKYRFWLVLLTAALLLEIPIVSIPLKWFESYFHEISHGLTALITGGSIVQIQLFPNGAGLCTTRGGISFLISFMGYAGAVFWGVIIYWFATVNQHMAKYFSAAIALLLISTVIFWIRDLLSFVIMAVLFVMILLKFKLNDLRYFQLFLQIIGATVLLNSIKSPWYLLDGRSLGDGAALAKITHIPELVWICLWFSLGVLGIYTLAKNRRKKI
ncbi:M50 family metallopeptidase [Colwelliaceae bacterium 6441]